MITGHLGQDAKLSQHGNDECVNFTVAATRRYKQGNETKEATQWYACTLWNPSRVKDYLKKGQMVLIEGRPGCRTYKNRAGETVAQLDINVQNVELLGKNDSAPAASATAPAANGTAPVNDPLGANNPLENETWDGN